MAYDLFLVSEISNTIYEYLGKFPFKYDIQFSSFSHIFSSLVLVACPYVLLWWGLRKVVSAIFNVAMGGDFNV